MQNEFYLQTGVVKMKKAVSILLVAIMISCFCACSSSEPEKIITKYIIAKEEDSMADMSRFHIVPNEIRNTASITAVAKEQDITNEEAEALICEGASETFGKTIKNVKEIDEEYHKLSISQLKEYYGEDYSINITVSESKELSEKELSNMIDFVSLKLESQNIILENFLDTSEIKQGMTIKATVSFTGSNIEAVEEKKYSLHLGLVNNAWKVFDTATISDNTGFAKPKDGTKLKLTSEMIEEIEDEVWGDRFEIICQACFVNTYGESANIQHFQKTAVKQTDEYTITVYGKLYFRNNYGDAYTKAQVIYTIESDKDEENGYAIIRDFKADTE